MISNIILLNDLLKEKFLLIDFIYSYVIEIVDMSRFLNILDY